MTLSKILTDRNIAIFGALLIATLCLSHIGYQYGISASDEFNYWAVGARMAGNTASWQEFIIYTNGFYSFGYGMLLAPLFLLGIPNAVIYKLMIGANALFLIGSFLLARYVGGEILAKRDNASCRQADASDIFPDVGSKAWIDKRIITLISLVVILYSNNIYQSQGGSPENLLYFLAWCLAALVCRTLTRDKPGDYLLMAAVSVYMYCVHNRSVGVLLAVVFFYVIRYIRALMRKENGRNILIGLFVMAVLFIIASVYLEQTVSWFSADPSAPVRRNTWDQQLERTARLLSAQGMANFLVSFAGKFFYHATASFMIIVLPMVIVARDLIIQIRDFIRMKKRGHGQGADLAGAEASSLEAGESACLSEEEKHLEENAHQAAQGRESACPDERKKHPWSHAQWLSFLFVVGFGASLVIAAIPWARDPQNVTARTLFYGRYADFAIGPLILMGVLLLLDGKKKLKELLISIAIYGICGIFIWTQYRTASVHYVWGHMVALDPFLRIDASPFWKISLAMLAAGGGYALLAAASLMRSFAMNASARANEHAGLRLFIIGIAAIGIYYAALGTIRANEAAAVGYEIAQDYYVVGEMMAEIDPDAVIYYAMEAEASITPVINFSFLYPERQIRVLSAEEFRESQIVFGECFYISSAEGELYEEMDGIMERLVFGRLCLYMP